MSIATLIDLKAISRLGRDRFDVYAEVADTSLALLAALMRRTAATASFTLLMK